MPEPRGSSRLPAWLPSGGLQLQRCGRWWDAVRVLAFDGVLAMGVLGPTTYSLIGLNEPEAALFQWLVSPSAAADWDLPHVGVLGDCAQAPIPPAAWTEEANRAAWWVAPPRGDCLADPDRLHEALVRVRPERPRSPASRLLLNRCACGSPVIAGEFHTCTADQDR